MLSSLKIFVTLCFLWPAASLLAQSQHITDSIRALSEQDHQEMMDQLHITTLRPPANGLDPHSPYAPNYDEAKANPYPKLPDPLRLNNGKEVKTAKQWWSERRPEIVEDFDREVYGRVPAHLPPVQWNLLSMYRDTQNHEQVIVKKLNGHLQRDSFSLDISLELTVPADAKGPVPVILELSWVFPAPPRPKNNPEDSKTAAPPVTSWTDQVLQRGWGYAKMIPTTVQPDNGAGLRKGIIGLSTEGRPRQPEDWGALRAWAWGASRALDYFETDSLVDARQVGITGHSRYGKAALIALAYDRRFAIGFISSSGEGGAKLHRRNAGEIVENLTSSGEYHWMAGNFMKYGGPLHWNDIPVDAHELIALCAPRPLFISAGNKGDAWVDARGMFMAAVAAGPVYRLLGKNDLGSSDFPPVEEGLTNGEIAFRQHNGGHTPGPNWAVFLDFAARYIHEGR